MASLALPSRYINPPSTSVRRLRVLSGIVHSPVRALTRRHTVGRKEFGSERGDGGGEETERAAAPWLAWYRQRIVPGQHNTYMHVLILLFSRQHPPLPHSATAYRGMASARSRLWACRSLSCASASSLALRRCHDMPRYCAHTHGSPETQHRSLARHRVNVT